jgi:hypothetical protein
MSGKVSLDERRRLVAESLQVGNPGNNARDLAGQGDPRTESQIELSIDEIRPYENNPRRAANAKFERRFRRIEAWLAASGRTPRDAAMAELEALWTRAKQEEG